MHSYQLLDFQSHKAFEYLFESTPDLSGVLFYIFRAFKQEFSSKV